MMPSPERLAVLIDLTVSGLLRRQPAAREIDPLVLRREAMRVIMQDGMPAVIPPVSDPE